MNFAYEPHRWCDIMLCMRFLPKFGCCEGSATDSEEAGAAVKDESEGASESELLEDSHLLKTVGWVSAALGAVALGLIVGREIRQRGWRGS